MRPAVRRQLSLKLLHQSIFIQLKQVDVVV